MRNRWTADSPSSLSMNGCVLASDISFEEPCCVIVRLRERAVSAAIPSYSLFVFGSSPWDLFPFTRYVEIGRVALINYGTDYGKLVVIVDVIDQNRALVDAPKMVRGQMNFKRLSLTDIKIDIPRVPKKQVLIEAMEAADVQKRWENSSWGRKLIVQKRRAALNDFDRFKVMLAKIKRGAVIRRELSKLKKANPV
eukprot:Gb_21078 [translate_table: standard]